MSYLFGACDEFVGSIRGDVAVICTHSGVEAMKRRSRRRVFALAAPQFLDGALLRTGDALIVAGKPALTGGLAGKRQNPE